MQSLSSSLCDQVNSTGIARAAALHSGVLLVTVKRRRGRENEADIKYKVFILLLSV